MTPGLAAPAAEAPTKEPEGGRALRPILAEVIQSYEDVYANGDFEQQYLANPLGGREEELLHTARRSLGPPRGKRYTLLDYGAGDGRLLAFACDWADELASRETELLMVATDPAGAALDACGRRLAAFGFENETGEQYRRRNLVVRLERSPVFGDGDDDWSPSEAVGRPGFDLTVSLNVVPHMPGEGLRLRALARMAAWTRGATVISAPAVANPKFRHLAPPTGGPAWNGDVFYTYGGSRVYYHLFRRRELEDLVRQAFAPCPFSIATSSLSHPALINGRPARCRLDRLLSRLATPLPAAAADRIASYYVAIISNQGR